MIWKIPVIVISPSFYPLFFSQIITSFLFFSIIHFPSYFRSFYLSFISHLFHQSFFLNSHTETTHTCCIYWLDSSYIKLVALRQIASSLWKPYSIQLGSSKIVTVKPEQAMRTHLDNSKAVSLPQTYTFLAVYCVFLSSLLNIFLLYSSLFFTSFLQMSISWRRWTMVRVTTS